METMTLVNEYYLMPGMLIDIPVDVYRIFSTNRVDLTTGLNSSMKVVTGRALVISNIKGDYDGTRAIMLFSLTRGLGWIIVREPPSEEFVVLEGNVEFDVKQKRLLNNVMKRF